jgi:hypothetical protein
MVPQPQHAAAPTPDEVRRICNIANPVLRNLEITHCYYRLSLAFTARTGECANWCTFAVWASRQAGRTIRGEDMIEAIVRNTLTGSVFSHPIQSFWRRLIQRGLLTPASRLGRLIAAIHSPFDAVERASDAVARGNLKVFEEIGFQFARYLHSCAPDERPDSDAFLKFAAGLRPGHPPEGQEYLKSAFAGYQRQFRDSDETSRAQRIYMANVLIGLHEQTRLQPEIQESLEVAPATAGHLGMRALQAIYPGAWNWAAFVRRPLAAALAPIVRRISKHLREATRRTITESLMTLAFPSTTLALGQNLDRVPASVLQNLSDPELLVILKRFETPDKNWSADDWADLTQRMRFIAPLFRCFHDSRELLDCPFTAEQVQSLSAGIVPKGRL